MTKTSELCPVPAGLDKRVADIRADKIDLSVTDMDRGRDIASTVATGIETLASIGKLPTVLPGKIFTGGSFGRRTQAQPLDDIDLFIPLDAKALVLESPAKVPTTEELVTGATPRSLGCRTDLHAGAWLDSAQTLDSVVAALQGIALPVKDVGKNPRGRCAHLTYNDVNVDLVFVLWSHRPGQIDRYHLPSGAGWSWRTANPKDDQDRLSRDNRDRHDERLLPTIRALKAWNDHVCRGRLKSIHLEVLALERIFANVEIDSVTSALTYALGQLPAALATPCPDPTGLGPNLDAALHPEDREWVRQKATQDSAQAAAANNLAATDIATGVQLWRALLLTDGPPAPDRGPRAAPQPGGHSEEYGQPAHHCSDTATIPPPKAEYRPVVPVNQRGRSGKYA